MGFKLLAVIILMIHTPNLYGRDLKKSAEYRSEKSWVFLWRAPTLTVVDTGYGTGETGFGIESVTSEQVSLFLNVQGGYAGNIGTFAGSGNAGRITAGYKRFFGNSFYLAPGIGVRHLSVGAVERRENKEYRSYDELYSNVEVYRNRATSVGANLGAGWQWQRNKVTIGLEVTTLFLPMANLYTKHSATDESYEQESKSDAKNLGLLFDSSIPRFVLGFAF